MTALRIVHAVRSDVFAGVERHVASLATAQRRAGHRVAVVGGDADLMALAIAHAGIPWRPAATTWATARAIDAFRACDVLHVHMTAAELAALVAVRAARVPAVCTRHFAGPRGTGPLGPAIAVAVRPRLAAQIAISRYVADHVDGPATVVHPGVPGRPDGAPAAIRDRSVLVAQRLEAEKGTDVALRAFAHSGLATQGWRLDVAGDGAQRAGLAAVAADLGIAPAVRFLGRRTDVDALMDRAGILLAPCTIEGLGLTVMEAMAAGLPVVAAAAGGHLETVGSVAGAALFAPDDHNGAATHLIALATDPAHRDIYAHALRTHQRTHFTLEAQERATAFVYRTVLEGARR